MIGLDGATRTRGLFAPDEALCQAELHREMNGAESRNRTDDVLLTMQLLCQLSYLGIGTLVPTSGIEPLTSSLPWMRSAV